MSIEKKLFKDRINKTDTAILAKELLDAGENVVSASFRTGLI